MSVHHLTTLTRRHSRLDFIVTILTWIQAMRAHWPVEYLFTAIGHPRHHLPASSLNRHCHIIHEIIPDKAYLIRRQDTQKWTTLFHQIVTV